MHKNNSVQRLVISVFLFFLLITDHSPLNTVSHAFEINSSSGQKEIDKPAASPAPEIIKIPSGKIKEQNVTASAVENPESRIEVEYSDTTVTVPVSRDQINVIRVPHTDL